MKLRSPPPVTTNSAPGRSAAGALPAMCRGGGTALPGGPTLSQCSGSALSNPASSRLATRPPGLLVIDAVPLPPRSAATGSAGVERSNEAEGESFAGRKLCSEDTARKTAEAASGGKRKERTLSLVDTATTPLPQVLAKPNAQPHQRLRKWLNVTYVVENEAFLCCHQQEFLSNVVHFFTMLIVHSGNWCGCFLLVC